jgi:hypothetical protein
MVARNREAGTPEPRTTVGKGERRSKYVPPAPIFNTNIDEMSRDFDPKENVGDVCPKRTKSAT